MGINRTLQQESIPGKSEENLQNKEEQDYHESNRKTFIKDAFLLLTFSKNV